MEIRQEDYVHDNTEYSDREEQGRSIKYRQAPVRLPQTWLVLWFEVRRSREKEGERSTRMPGEDGEFVESRTEYEGGAGVGFQFRREKRRWSEW